MSYSDWFNAHAKKHASIMKTLANLSKEQVIDYFQFDNLQQKESNFCPLFATNTKCHTMKKLNCYFCACPYFRFNDGAIEDASGNVIKSWCHINAREAKQFVDGNVIHLDCSECFIAHQHGVIQKQFKRNWLDVMHACSVKSE